MAKFYRERLALARAMKASKAHPEPGECDYVPGMELVGVYAAHAAVTRMVLREQLSPKEVNGKSVSLTMRSSGTVRRRKAHTSSRRLTRLAFEPESV